MLGKKWKNSDEEKVHLEKIDFDAAGRYYCEVSTETPIYTKESNIEQVHVIGKFNRKKIFYYLFLFLPLKSKRKTIMSLSIIEI